VRFVSKWGNFPGIITTSEVRYAPFVRFVLKRIEFPGIIADGKLRHAPFVRFVIYAFIRQMPHIALDRVGAFMVYYFVTVH
jgi:hypothetical protein